ncbi:hypothetical protein OS965_20270 [Streptomyces sp. H27-G5]|nr:hypothetical protein [Streptomyces sp. H27-G5]MCY0920487.1 hypothetical protein [Streptomyces sp. H27-G5]
MRRTEAGRRHGRRRPWAPATGSVAVPVGALVVAAGTVACDVAARRG